MCLLIIRHHDRDEQGSNLSHHFATMSLAQPCQTNIPTWLKIPHAQQENDPRWLASLHCQETLVWSRPQGPKKVHLKMPLHLSVLEPLEKVEVPKYQVVDKLGLGWRLLACCWKGVIVLYMGTDGSRLEWKPTQPGPSRTVFTWVCLKTGCPKVWWFIIMSFITSATTWGTPHIWIYVGEAYTILYSLSFTGELRTLND